MCSFAFCIDKSNKLVFAKNNKNSYGENMDGNLTKTEKFEKRRDIIQIIISIFSTIIVLFTLFEMQAQRNAAYRPDIVLSNAEAAIVWDKNNLETDSGESFETISKFKNDKTNINSIPKIKISNLGVGTAKDVQINWNKKDNINCLSDAFKQIENINVFYDNGTVKIVKDKKQCSIIACDNIKFDFVSNSPENKDEMSFPLAYSYLINELYINNQSKNIPDLFVDITYSDIQGKTYSKKIRLSIIPSFGTINPDGSGGYVYNIIAKKEDVSMSFLGFTNIGSDDLVAITSVFAVMVSIISIIFTIIFSMQQIKHNKNSVRPISAIKIADYENRISVGIANVGTGPLTITKFVAEKNGKEYNDLISIMPHIHQNWTTYMESIENCTIPVGGKITLIELTPNNELDKRNVRLSLADITIHLEYTDIYSTKFIDKKKLEFFGRHNYQAETIKI